MFLSACGRTPTYVVETVEATKEIEAEVVATATPTAEPSTPTPEPPTLTPFPTNTPTSVPIFDYSIETVSFTTEDDIELEGTLFLSEGDTAVVFAHMAGGDNDQQNWIPFAKEVARRGFTALTFNFRCYGESGCGGRDSGSILLSKDVGAAIDFLRKQGFERIVCAGASMGGRGCVNVAFDRELEGIIIVAGTGSSDPDRQDLADFISPNMPKLFIVSENDHIVDRTLAMTSLYESAPEPKIFKTYPGSAHGTELFDTRYAQAFRETIFSFLYEIR
jgi:esterase/lipase